MYALNRTYAVVHFIKIKIWLYNICIRIVVFFVLSEGLIHCSSYIRIKMVGNYAYFSYDFDSYSPFLCQKSKSLPSLFAQSLFFKDWWDRFAYGHSFVKNDGSDSRANRSLDHKKQAIRSKNRWSNSQPCRVLNQNLDKNWTGKILYKIILTSKIPIKVVNFLWTIEKFSDSAKESVTKAAKSFTSLKGQYCL